MLKDNLVERMSTNPIVAIGWRILLYGCLMLILSKFLMWDASVAGPIKFSENTFTEWTQQIILLTMTLLFIASALQNPAVRAMSILLAGVSLIGLVREYNNFFNERVFDGAWQLLAAVVLIIVLLFFYPHRKNLMANLRWYHGTLSQGFLIAGFLSTFIYSRLFGRTTFWQTLMEEDYIRSAKNAGEEGVELLGYSLLLIASAEFFLYQRKNTEVKPLINNGSKKGKRSI